MRAERAGVRRALAAAIVLAALAAACEYPAQRDMRRSVVMAPQAHPLDPADGSVPTTGIENPMALEVAAATLKNPVPADTASLRRGEQTYAAYCTPCHGAQMNGQGPVAAKFMPPPDLMAKMTRDRSDGYIYRYVRFGGAVMPKYGFALSSSRVWDVVNYVRHMQKVQPR